MIFLQEKNNTYQKAVKLRTNLALFIMLITATPSKKLYIA